MLCIHIYSLAVSMVFIHAANENNPVSVCSFCSDSRAGVRWIVHESNGESDDPYESINIVFRCEIPEENVVSI